MADKPQWKRGPRIQIEDTMRTENVKFGGFIRILVHDIKNLIQEKSLPSVTGPFLGLAAGEGMGEKIFAKSFGLEKNVILVDKIVDKPSETFIQKDLFEFLETWNGESFGLITLIGAEYVIKTEENWNRLWRGLSRVSRPGTFIGVAPIHPDHKMPLPNDLAFEVLVDDQLYVIALKK